MIQRSILAFIALLGINLIANFRGLSVEALEFGCASDYCERFQKSCENIDQENLKGRILKNATKCGCCDVMMISLKKGESCEKTENKPIPRAECGDQLMCIENLPKPTCKEATTKCMTDLLIFERDIGKQELTTGKPKPKCNEVGYYEPVQCKAGLMCKCVDKDGNRIFGEAPFSKDLNMNCQCSRDIDRYVKTGLLDEDSDYFMRCSANGDYDGPQCTDTHCYCIGKNGELRSQQVPRLNGTAILPCFDAKIHYKNFITPCLRERQELKNQTKELEDNGIMVLGIDWPKCDLDGFYAAKQCRDSECYCSDKFGKRYQSTGVTRYSQEEQQMKYCNCVREKDYLKDIVTRANQFSQYKCQPNGDYLPIQCTTSFCFCVDPENGYQEGETRLISARTELTACWKEDYEAILDIRFD